MNTWRMVALNICTIDVHNSLVVQGNAFLVFKEWSRLEIIVWDIEGIFLVISMFHFFS